MRGQASSALMVLALLGCALDDRSPTLRTSPEAGAAPLASTGGSDDAGELRTGATGAAGPSGAFEAPDASLEPPVNDGGDGSGLLVGSLAACATVEDPLPECCELACADDACEAVPVAEGTPTALQTTGSCLQRRCDGKGGVVSVPADALCDDGNYCNGAEVCQPGGACANGAPPCEGHDIGASCADSCDEALRACSAPDAVRTECLGGIGIGLCDGEGECRECLGDGDCVSPGRPFCEAPGLCVQCRGPDDCSGDTPICIDGACGCDSSDDCPARGECAIGACEGSVCGTAPVPRGLVLASQVAFDCRVRQCDGSGGIEEVADDSDVPPDPGGGCVLPACRDGQVEEAPRPAGVACGESATACSDVDRCDGDGVCALNHFPNGRACDDGRYCTNTDRCSNGVCAGSGTVCTPQRNCSEELDRCLQCTEDRDCDEFCGPGRPGSCDLNSHGCRC